MLPALYFILLPPQTPLQAFIGRFVKPSKGRCGSWLHRSAGGRLLPRGGKGAVRLVKSALGEAVGELFFSVLVCGLCKSEEVFVDLQEMCCF